MIRYIAQFHKGGFPEQYVVMEVLSASERYQIGEPKTYHEANDEAGERNDGSWGKPKPLPVETQVNAMAGWLGGLTLTP